MLGALEWGLRGSVMDAKVPVLHGHCSLHKAGHTCACPGSRAAPPTFHSFVFSGCLCLLSMDLESLLYIPATHTGCLRMHRQDRLLTQGLVPGHTSRQLPEGTLDPANRC